MIGQLSATDNIFISWFITFWNLDYFRIGANIAMETCLDNHLANLKTYSFFVFPLRKIGLKHIGLTLSGLKHHDLTLYFWRKANSLLWEL